MGTVKKAFSQTEVRRRLLFLFFAFIVIRIFANIPIPGVNADVFRVALGENEAFGLMNLFAGGGLENMSILTLSVTPYITASIIMQLLAVAFPSIEGLSKDGEEGRKKLSRITKYLGIIMAAVQAVALTVGFRNQLLLSADAFSMILVPVVMTAGSSFLIWLGDRISENGLGNGISVILLFNILSRVPGELFSLYENFISGKTIPRGILAAVIILLIIIVTIILTLLLNSAERRIPVQYSQKMNGRRLVGRGASELPIKVNLGGVIPVIFASTILSLPGILSGLFGIWNGERASRALQFFNQGAWFSSGSGLATLGAVLYGVLIIAFAYFYANITFNPIEIADNLKKSGGTIQGIRPGGPTVDYLKKILKSLIPIGAIWLFIVCLIPIVCNGVFHAGVSFGGTSLIIVASVILEIIKQIDALLAAKDYSTIL